MNWRSRCNPNRIIGVTKKVDFNSQKHDHFAMNVKYRLAHGLFFFLIAFIHANEALSQQVKPEYEKCLVLSYRDRNDCLLSQSYVQAYAENDPESIRRFRSGVDFDYSLFLEGTNYFYDGQEFSTLMRPYINWEWTPRSQWIIDMRIQQWNGTGGGSEEVSFGRPGLGYIYTWNNKFNLTPQLQIKIRFPLYSGYREWNHSNLDPAGTRRVWRIEVANRWDWHSSPTHHWFVTGTASYNTERKFASESSSFVGDNVNQSPILGTLEMGHSWKLSSWDISSSFRTEQTLQKGNILSLGAGAEEINHTKYIASNALKMEFQNEFTKSIFLNVRIIKSLIEKPLDLDYKDVNFDEPTYGTNLSVGTSIIYLL
jgi:hypothetical protein